MAKIKPFSEVCWDYAWTITPKLKKSGWGAIFGAIFGVNFGGF
jgi:hypothetical protein